MLVSTTRWGCCNASAQPLLAPAAQGQPEPTLHALHLTFSNAALLHMLAQLAYQ